MLIGLAAFGFVVAGGAVLFRAAAQERRLRWSRVGRELALELSELPTWLGRGLLRGTRLGLPVTVGGRAYSSYGRSPHLVTVTVDLRGTPLAALELESRLLLRAVPEIELGDERFDRRMALRGEVDLALAALSAEARERWLRLSGSCSVRLGDGLLRGHASEIESAEAVLEQLLALLVLLQVPEGALDERLLRNLRTEPVEAVALRLLGRLLARRSAVLEAALHHALAAGKVQPELCLYAAAASAGQEAREAVAAMAHHPGTSDELRARAYARWLALDPGAAQAVDALAETAGPKLLAELIAVMVRNGARDQPRLIRWLHHLAPEVAVAAAQALAEVGDREALYPLSNTSGSILAPAALRRAAKDALERIRARVGPAEAGRLSVSAAPQGGALSVAADEGALSEPRGGSEPHG